MLTIRLHRTGKRHQPLFRIVLAEKKRHPSKKFLEILGTYNPRNKEFAVKNEERVHYWISQHVELSPTVHNLLVSHNLLKDTSKVQAWKPKKRGTDAEQTQKSEGAPASDAKAETVEPKAEAATEAPAEETKLEEPKESTPAVEQKSE